jgi:hypothetical protein
LGADESDVYTKAAGKSDYTEAKAYRPTSLSSFVLKTMETLVDKHIRDSVLEYPLHQNQYVHQLENALKLRSKMW